MRWTALLFKVAVAGAAGAFLAASVAGAKPPRPAPDPHTVKEIPVTPDRAEELTELRNTPPGSAAPAPAPPPATHTPRPRPTAAEPTPHLLKSPSPVSTGAGPAESGPPAPVPAGRQRN
ncbi:hypothetical protein ACFZBM_14175 [Streptomyces lavendulae]|uniref:Uncharacterized protein n=1 Tax=Streptomyces lavendulae subsp. lavendulae TaxID=58340 RepID=A0A2K8PHC0_STRLA|nr:hypothetical protein [Streptomyces lavendulae]ATZ25858.1 hypothetical protein SLAV_20170 [Streptomyces lavendulae subsp. lavendulae]QUQ55687.1 hypothetical protein SLLC_18275 [Streptomyces lavendulae subsp. lavendulae]